MNLTLPDFLTDIDQMIANAPDGEPETIETKKPNLVREANGWGLRYVADFSPLGDEWVTIYQEASKSVSQGGLVAFLGNRGTGKTQMAAPIMDKQERYITNLCRSVNIACDEWQIRNNGYNHRGLRDVINTAAATGEAEKMANEMARAAREADRMKNSLATKIGSDIKARQESEAVDPGGKLMKKAQEQISTGAYKAAEATGAQIRTREQEAMIRGVGSQSDRRALSDIAKDYGLDTMGKTSTQMRDELYKIRTEGQGTSDKIKKGLETTQKRMGEGMKTEAGKKAEEKKAPMTLENMVKIIQDAVVKLETKLPQPILA